jgi:hypothetical protein
MDLSWTFSTVDCRSIYLVVYYWEFLILGTLVFIQDDLFKRYMTRNLHVVGTLQGSNLYIKHMQKEVSHAMFNTNTHRKYRIEPKGANQIIDWRHSYLNRGDKSI